MIMRILAVVILFSASLATMATESAYACSCVHSDPLDAIEISSAAFIGRIISRVEPPHEDIRSSTGLVSYTFAVESVAKGNLTEFVEVVSPISSASCGFGNVAQVGNRMAITLSLNDDHNYQSGLCSTMSPAEMASASVLKKPLTSETPNISRLSTPVPLPGEPPSVPKDDIYRADSDPRPSSWVISAGLGLVLLILFIGYRVTINRKTTS